MVLGFLTGGSWVDETGLRLRFRGLVTFSKFFFLLDSSGLGVVA